MATRREVIDDLRRQIERFGGAQGSRKSLPFGVSVLDRHLPGRGLTLGALHEVIEEGPLRNSPEPPRSSRPGLLLVSKGRCSGA